MYIIEQVAHFNCSTQYSIGILRLLAPTWNLGGAFLYKNLSLFVHPRSIHHTRLDGIAGEIRLHNRRKRKLASRFTFQTICTNI